MWPVLFTWRGVTIRSFPVAIYAATLVGAEVAIRAAQSRGLDTARCAIAIVMLACCILLGARAAFVGLNWRRFGRDWRDIFDRKQGGMSVSGGLLLALVCSPAVLFWLRLPFAAFWDSAALGMLAGLPVAKLGCLLHGCCCGRPTPGWLGLSLPDHHGIWRRRIPTQLLEMAWATLLLLLLLRFETTLKPGVLFCLAMGGYSAPRFFFHRLRETTPASDGRFGRALLSAAIVLLAGYLAWLLG